MNAKSLVMSCLVMVSCVSQAKGTIRTFEFTGVVNTVTEGGPPDFPIVGDAVTGLFSYALDSPDSDPRFDTGRYFQSIPSGFSILVGSMYLEYDNYSINIFNRIPGVGPWDAFSVSSDSDSPYTGVGFQGVDRDIFTSTDLPLTLDLSKLLPIDAGGVIIGPQDIYRIDFTLLTMTPEPATLLLLGLGAMMLRRKINFSDRGSYE